MRILITAGPTREFFDSIRFISNPSSGKMGYALASRAAQRGHHVVLISGPVSIRAPQGVQTVRVVTAAEMAAEVRKRHHQVDAAIMTAAVCDYRPHRRLMHKLKKQARTRRILLEPTEDIAATFGQHKGKRILIGFAMEDHDHRANAEAKLRRKRCDAIVLNGPENVAADRANIFILTADGTWFEPMKGTKVMLAGKIIRLAEKLHDDNLRDSR